MIVENNNNTVVTQHVLTDASTLSKEDEELKSPLTEEEVKNALFYFQSNKKFMMVHYKDNLEFNF